MRVTRNLKDMCQVLTARNLTGICPTLSCKSFDSTEEENHAEDASGWNADQEKLKEHNKLRMEIKKVHYPAAKTTIVAHVKGIKADDKKWFDQTLPDKTYTSADDVYSALGWSTAPAPSEK